MVGVILLFVVPVIFLLYRYVAYVKKYEDIAKLPGPSIWDITSLYRQISSEGLITFLQSFNKKYGSIVKIWIKPLKPIIITTDMEFVEKIYKSNELFYAPGFTELINLLGSGVGTASSHEIWKTDKQIISKSLSYSYTSDRLKTYNKKYDKFIEIIVDNLGKAIDVEEVLYRIQPEVIIESLNDPQINFTDDEVTEYIAIKNEYMDLLSQKMNSPIMGTIFFKFTNNYRLFMGSAKKLIRIGEEILKRHESIPRDKRDKHNLIYAMMDNGMPQDRILDNIHTIIMGGYETSVLPLSLIMYELGKRPEIQQKILDEVLSVVGPPQSKKLITLNDLNEMTYLHCVIKESLRVFYPVPFVDRLLVKDMKVKNITIPKGTTIIFHLAQILKSEENYPSPNVFNPDRFLPQNIDKKAKNGFVSFGFGLKICPGKHLSISVMKLLITKVIREFEISSVGNDHKIQLRADFVFRSTDGIPVVFKRRSYDLDMQ